MTEYSSKEEAIESHPEFMNPNVTRDSTEETNRDRAYANGWNDAIKAYIKELKELPSKDPRQLVYVTPGYWIEHISEIFPADSTVECSVCHEHVSALLVNLRYCPNCGAKMDGEEDERSKSKIRCGEAKA